MKKKLICSILAVATLLSTATTSFAMEKVMVDNIIYTTNYQWENSYAGMIEVKNNTGGVLHDWEVTFELENSIIDIENAQVKSHEGNLVTLESKATTSYIDDGGSIYIALEIEGSSEKDIPKDIKLDGQVSDNSTVPKVNVNDKNLSFSEDDSNGFYVVNELLQEISGIQPSDTTSQYDKYTLYDEFDNEVITGNLIDEGGSYKIIDLGLHIGYNKISLFDSSNMSNIPIQFTIVNFEENNAKKLGIDIEVDSDEDNVSDYIESRLGLNPYSAHSLDDERTDYEMIMGTDTSSLSSDTPQPISDIVIDSQNMRESNSERASISSMTIHQTKKYEGRKQGSTQTNYDLTFNDYTYEDLLALGSIFSVAYVTPESLMWGEMAAIFVPAKRPGSSMNAVLDDLIDTFRNGTRDNEGESVYHNNTYQSSRYIKFSDTALTSEVENHENTEYYTDLIADYVTTYISNGGNPYDLRFSSSSNDNLIEDYVYSFSTSPYPSYGGVTALGIAIHGWHGHNIKLTDYRETATGFSGTLEFHFYDHFGLDYDDEVTVVGFCDWFTLQHYQRFDGKYSPFLTYADISVDFSGRF